MVRTKSQTLNYFSATPMHKDATIAGESELPEPAYAYMRPACKSWAFTHELEKGIPDLMAKECDVFYAELPWNLGFESFYEAAGVTPKWTYKEFLTCIRKEVLRIGKPTILVCGNVALRVLKPEATATVILNRKEVRLALWGIEDTWGRVNTIDVIHDLAKRFNTVGDFACGYGRTGKIFTEHGKKWFMSDFNPHCIGFIKENAEKW